MGLSGSYEDDMPDAFGCADDSAIFRAEVFYWKSGIAFPCKNTDRYGHSRGWGMDRRKEGLRAASGDVGVL